MSNFPESFVKPLQLTEKEIIYLLFTTNLTNIPYPGTKASGRNF